MNFLRDLFVPKRAKATPAPDGPAPLVMPSPEDGSNPITALLAAWRLPLAEPRAVVQARHGIVTDPIYNWPALLLPDAVSLPGAMRAWSASVHDGMAPHFPISHFSGLVWFEDNAENNLRRTASHIATALGPAPIGRRWNTVIAAWTADLAEIRLTAWPPHLQDQRLQNPAEDRNPHLKHACHIEIATGFCLPLTDVERLWIETSRQLRSLSAHGYTLQSSAPFETELDYTRRVDPGMSLTSGLYMAADGQALVVVSSQLYVIPRRTIRSLEVVRLTPAKGGGGSSLYAICDSAAPDPDGKSLMLARDSEPDGLNAFARDLAKQLACPIEIGPAYPDC